MAGIRKTIFDGKSRNEPLGNIASIYQPQTISSSDLESNGIYPVYGANGIIGRYSKYNHETEQVIITCRGNTCGTVNYSSAKSWITGNSMVINCDKSLAKINKRYLYHYLCYCDFTSIISGSGQPQIVRTPLINYKIYLPDSTKQLQVAKLLDSNMKKIEYCESILSLYIQQKQFLLSKMFI